MELIELEAENYHDTIKALKPPVMAFGVCIDDNPDVILIYDDLQEAA